MISHYKNIFNIPASCPFWESLASIYIDKFSNNQLGLANVDFLVSNRRNCIALTNAFIKLQDGKPTILPKITPISEIDDDELFFSYFDCKDILEEQYNPISREDRLFLLAKMIMLKPNEFGIKQLSLVQALNLAENLANFLDTCYNQGLSFDKLNELAPEKYATHWQETLKLLKIITFYWPQILEERGVIDVCLFKNRILEAQADYFNETKPDKHIVVAGVSASFPSYIKLMKSIIGLKNGEIYFAGIDRCADEEYWNAIDETHPQFEIKDLLDKLKLEKNLIKDICEPLNKDREYFVSELMRPALVSHRWREISNKFKLETAINDVLLITSKTQREEGLAIALKLREILEEEGKTACLVTYDRNLARRVSAELKRFDIDVDDSAGVPLSLTPIGIYLRQIVEYCLDTNSQTKLMGLLKNPFVLMGYSFENYKDNILLLEKELRNHNKKELSSENALLLDKIKNFTSEFIEALNSNVEFGELLKKHIELAEKLATSDSNDGKSFLWKGEEAKSVANFVSKMLNSSCLVGEIRGIDYLSIISLFMNNETVRKKYGTHPYLSILGPIEAQLQNFDYIIIGEANEGIWPKIPEADMWMSRPMMSDFGFSLPEKSIGILANSFTNFLMTKNVIITRAERIGETPTQKSRWLLRLETVLKALGKDITEIEDECFVEFINSIDRTNKFLPIKPPTPTPPLKARPRVLSASGLDLLIDDPYSVFAKYILKLHRLDDLDQDVDQRDFGTLIHNIIEEFNNTYNNSLPDDALNILIEIGKKHFDVKNLEKDVKAFWWPKFLVIAEWVYNQEKEYRKDVKKIHNEISGEISYNLPEGVFKFNAKADRIDELNNGKINIIDYKTGAIPRKSQVESGHAMQLLLEGLIARNGAYNLNSSNMVNKLIYWRLGKEKLELENNIEELLDKSEGYILKLMTTFDFETTPYHSRPTPKYIPKNRDYEHLARIREWSVLEDGESDAE